MGCSGRAGDLPLGVGGWTVDEDARDSSVSGESERERTSSGSGSSVWISISPMERGMGASVWVKEVVEGGGVVWMLREVVRAGMVWVELWEMKEVESYWVHALAYSFEVSMVVDLALFALLFPPWVIES